MYNRLTQEAFYKVFEIVKRRNPEMLSFPFFSTRFGLTEDQREEIREVLADELVEYGLKKNSEPTEYGLLIENLIDLLDQVSEKIDQ